MCRKDLRSSESGHYRQSPSTAPTSASAATDEQIFPEGGGLQIRDAAGEVIGAVGVTGDTEDRDEELAAHGIHAIGLKTDEDCAAMGRRHGIRLTNR